MNYFLSNKILTINPKWDKWVIGSALIILIAASFQLLKSTQNLSDDTSLTELLNFKIDTLQNDVRIRHQSQLAWTNMRKETQMYMRDQVFTGTNSWTTIKDSKNNAIELSPNSLIELSFANDQPEILIKQGEIRANLKEGTTIKVKAKEKSYEIKSGAKSSQVQLQVSEANELSLKSSSDISIQTSTGERIVMQPQEELTIKNDGAAKVNKIQLSLLAPKDQTSFWSKKDSSIAFSWGSENTQSNYNLKIQNKSTGEIQSVSTTSMLENMKNTFAPGSYVWWVEGKSSEGDLISSSKNNFNIMAIKPPEIFKPKNGFVVLSKTSSTKIDFEWDSVQNASNYKWRLYQDNALKEELSTQDTYLQKNLSYGNYQWSITAESEASEDTATSNFESFTIQADLPKEVPTFKILTEAEYFITSANLMIDVTWEDKLGADNYEIKLINLDNNEQKILKSSTNKATLELDTPGEFQIDISAFSNNLLVGKGQSQVFKIKKANIPKAPKLKKLEYEFETNLNSNKKPWWKIVIHNLFGFTAFAQEVPAGAKIKFAWEDVDGAREYWFELSKDKKFTSTLIKEKTKEAKYQWRSPKEAGYYFWRVRAIEQFGFMGPYSELGSIQLRSIEVEKPILKEPIEQPAPEETPSIANETTPIEPPVKSFNDILIPPRHFAFGLGVAVNNSTQTPNSDATTYLSSTGAGFIPSLELNHWGQTGSWYHFEHFNYGQSSLEASGLDGAETIDLSTYEFTHYSYKRIFKSSQWVPGLGLRYKKYIFFVDNNNFSEDENRLGLALSAFRTFETTKFRLLQHIFKADLGVGQLSDFSKNLFSKLELNSIYNFKSHWSYILRLSFEYQAAEHTVSGSDGGSQTNLIFGSVFQLGYNY